MGIPANIRLNVSFPFPAVITGSGPVGIGKNNGIWTVTLNFDALGVQTPPLANYPTDFVVVWDSIARTFFKMPLSAISSQAAGARPQRFVTTSPIIVGANDQVLNCGINGAAVCQLPLAATRSGIPVTFKDMGFATAHPITITPTAPDLMDGLSSFIIGNDRQGITFVPVTDGVNGGWEIQ